MAKMLNCPHCGVASEIGDPHFKALGREVSRLQSRVHRQRVAHVKLKLAYRQLYIEHDRQRKLIDEARHAVASARDQAQKLSASMREGALHGIVLPKDADRLEGMTLIIQQLREKNMEQHRALTQVTSAGQYALDSLADEHITAKLSLMDALESAQSVINGSKSLITQEIERQQAIDVNHADNVKTMATRWLTDLITRVGPVRKRDLKAAIETIAKL